jgi:hypothetical protein
MIRMLSVVLIAVLLTGCAAHVRSDPQPRPLADDRSGAVLADIWHVPGRAATCAGAAVLSIVTMTVTFGYEYETASQIMHGGCGGPWLASPQAIRDAGVRDTAPR